MKQIFEKVKRIKCKYLLTLTQLTRGNFLRAKVVFLIFCNLHDIKKDAHVKTSLENMSKQAQKIYQWRKHNYRSNRTMNRRMT